METINTTINSAITRIQSTLRVFIDFFYFHSENRKNYYPCKLLPKYHLDEKNNLIIQYKTFGNRNYFEISIRDLFADKDLLAKFHPLEVSKITCIAMGEIIFSLPENQRENKFIKMKNKILKGIE